MSPEQLEIFILTYNRAKFLEELLYCLSNQSVSGFNVTILDNASNDNTRIVASKFKQYGYSFRSNAKNIGSEGSFRLAQKLSSKKYTIILHDDDLVHSNYIEDIINLISRCSAAPAFIGSKMIFTDKPHPKLWKSIPLSKRYIFLQSQIEFATLLYDGYPLHFGSVVYQTKLLKQINLRTKTYGKISDRPFLIEFAKNGSVYIFDYPYIQYRMHENQDSACHHNGPFCNELLSLHKQYYLLLGDNVFTKSGRTYIRNILKNLHSEARAINMNVIEYFKKVLHSGVLTYQALCISLIFLFLSIPMKLFKKIVAKIL
jgi:glycosyltransferase involved in cell wall biosynthesis